MTTFSIQIDVTRAALKVRTLRQQLHIVVDGSMEEWEEENRKELKSEPYPPKPPTSRYERTGQLANRWAKRRVSMTGTKIIWAIINAAVGKYGQKYARYPVGDEEGHQAWMHEGRWWVALKKLEERLPKLAEKIRRDIIRAWGK